jgi:dTMP kinase
MSAENRNEKPRGWFVTFEGGEGSGKTTQIRRLAEALRERGFDVIVTREPGGSPGADAIRHIVLSGAAEGFGGDVEALLFAAARIDHIETLVRPALDDGKVVLCDRFHDSTRVYQATGSAENGAFLSAVEDATLTNIYPDVTVVLDVPAAIGLARAAARRGVGEADRFEKEATEIHDARRERFLEIARAEPERCIVIDAGRSENAVAASVASGVFAKLGLETPSAGDGNDKDRGAARIDP